MSKFIGLLGVHTLRDEYHKALENGLDWMLATEEVKLQVRWMHNHKPDVYISLAVIAKRGDRYLLTQAVTIMMQINR